MDGWKALNEREKETTLLDSAADGFNPYTEEILPIGEERQPFP